MDLNALVLFANVVEAGSLSGAARRLNIPVSTVSRRIAEFEHQIGAPLLHRSTRRLSLTELGSDILEQARRGALVGEAVRGIVSSRLARAAEVLRLSAPPSISDTLIAPLVGAFSHSHPDIRVKVLIASGPLGLRDNGIDIALRIGAVGRQSATARTVLTYRHQLVASPAYFGRHEMPRRPHDLLAHRLLAFSFWEPEKRWTFVNPESGERETVTFEPSFEMNDYAGLAAELLAGGGIGELPPIVLPDLLREHRLEEVMPDWRFEPLNLTLVHASRAQMPRQVSAFVDFAVAMAPKLFPDLPT